jgi:hypothetical protein
MFKIIMFCKINLENRETKSSTTNSNNIVVNSTANEIKSLLRWKTGCRAIVCAIRTTARTSRTS